jgi:hypothetical protein
VAAAAAGGGYIHTYSPPGMCRNGRHPTKSKQLLSKDALPFSMPSSFSSSSSKPHSWVQQKKTFTNEEIGKAPEKAQMVLSSSSSSSLKLSSGKLTPAALKERRARKGKQQREKAAEKRKAADVLRKKKLLAHTNHPWNHRLRNKVNLFLQTQPECTANLSILGNILCKIDRIGMSLSVCLKRLGFLIEGTQTGGDYIKKMSKDYEDDLLSLLNRDEKMFADSNRIKTHNEDFYMYIYNEHFGIHTKNRSKTTLVSPPERFDYGTMEGKRRWQSIHPNRRIDYSLGRPILVVDEEGRYLPPWNSCTETKSLKREIGEKEMHYYQRQHRAQLSSQDVQSNQQSYSFLTKLEMQERQQFQLALQKRAKALGYAKDTTDAKDTKDTKDTKDERVITRLLSSGWITHLETRDQQRDLTSTHLQDRVTSSVTSSLPAWDGESVSMMPPPSTQPAVTATNTSLSSSSSVSGTGVFSLSRHYKYDYLGPYMGTVWDEEAWDEIDDNTEQHNEDYVFSLHFGSHSVLIDGSTGKNVNALKVSLHLTFELS